MRAIDVMVRDVVTVHPDTEIARRSGFWRNTTSARCPWSTAGAGWLAF